MTPLSQSILSLAGNNEEHLANDTGNIGLISELLRIVEEHQSAASELKEWALATSMHAGPLAKVTRISEETTARLERLARGVR